MSSSASGDGEQNRKGSQVHPHYAACVKSQKKPAGGARGKDSARRISWLTSAPAVGSLRNKDAEYGASEGDVGPSLARRARTPVRHAFANRSRLRTIAYSSTFTGRRPSSGTHYTEMLPLCSGINACGGCRGVTRATRRTWLQ